MLELRPTKQGDPMNKMVSLIFFMVFACGCATVIPGQTSASPRLKGDILGTINMIESSQAPGCSHKVVDTKAVGMDGDTVKEEWIVESCGKPVVYPVELTSDPNGGAYFRVTTPGKGR